MTANPTNSHKDSLAARITKKARSNLAMSFFSLSNEKREDMEIFYAFCRRVDDIADDEGIPIEDRKKMLTDWVSWIDQMYHGLPSDELAAALAGVARKYLILPDHLKEIVLGVEMDLSINRYKTWAELEQYCYRVASCVGLVSIEIFGYKHSSTREYARLLGLALQTTNILRDVYVDLTKKRIYLPEEDFISCGVTPDDLKLGVYNARLLPVFHRMASRAEYFFNSAERELHAQDRPNMIAAQVMSSVYRKLLHKVKSSHFRSMSRAMSLTKIEKGLAALSSSKRERKMNHLRIKSKAKQVVVIGAGVAGLTAATRLAKSGHKVTLLDARATAGGRTHSWLDSRLGITVDNGQHALMGCYHATLEWITQLGSLNNIPEKTSLDVSYALSSGAISKFAAPHSYPAPFHLLKAISGFSAINLSEKISCGRVMLSAKNKNGSWRGQTVADWLQDCGQSPNAVTAVWEPIAVAALNEPISSGSAELFRNVILEAFTGSAKNAHIILPKKGLTDVYVNPALNYLNFCGASVHLGSAVKEIVSSNSVASSVKSEGGNEFTADAVICATPWQTTARLLQDENPKIAQKISQLRGAPIVGIHLVFNKKIFSDSFVGLLPSPIQWVFHLNSLHDLGSDSAHHYAITISAAYREVELPRAELIALAMTELNKFFPDTVGLEPLSSFIYKSREATFSATPDNLSLRPQCDELGTNIFLAGGWTDTSLPDTIEGAARSGLKAAECVEKFLEN